MAAKYQTRSDLGAETRGLRHEVSPWRHFRDCRVRRQWYLAPRSHTEADVTSLKWVWPDSPGDEVIAKLATQVNVHPLVARVLWARGKTNPAEASAFLAASLTDLPDPFAMKGMTAAVERLVKAVKEKEAITLYGDYDVDGVCSTAVMKSFLDQLGANVATYIPHRLDEGYGLNKAAIEKVCADGTRLLVTLDCGITSHEEVSLAVQRGVDVIVVDHHAVPATMPPALAVLNPLQPGCEYGTKHLCTGGVVFNVCMALRKTLRQQEFFAGRAEPNLKALLDLVALATVADVVPLTQANRVLVTHGLLELSEGRRAGVRALKNVARLTGSDISAGQVGFRLAPRINAAGRLDDASVGLRMLLADTTAAADEFAQVLEKANAERQAIERTMVNEALEQAAEHAARGARGLVLWSESWHPGVVGIVASRVVEKFFRPVVVIGSHEGQWRGSGRSIEAFHLYDALAKCQPHLARFGGHKHAAGVSVEKSSLESFRAAFEAEASQRLAPDDLHGKLRVDAVVTPTMLEFGAVEALEAMGPFGAGNPTPVVAFKRVSVTPKVLRSKHTGEPEHLKLSIDGAPQIDLIAFGMANRVALTEGPVDVAGSLEIDEFNGRRKISVKVKDLRASA